MSVHKKAILALFTASLIWGISPPIIKYSLGFISPELYLFYRFLITCLVLLPFFLIKIRNRYIPNTDFARYALLGFLSTPLNLLLFFAGIKITTATDSTLISIISPIIVIAGGALFLKEIITRREKIGISVVVIGTILTIIQPFFETNLIGPKGNLYGNLLVFLGTLAGAGYVLLYKTKGYRHLDPFLLTGISFFVGLVCLYPILLLTNQSLIPHINSWPGILFMAIFGSAIAYFFHNYGISKIEVSEASLFTYLQPVIAVPLSIIFLKEPLTPIFIIGSLFIIFGLLVAESKKQQTSNLIKINHFPNKKKISKHRNVIAYIVLSLTLIMTTYGSYTGINYFKTSNFITQANQLLLAEEIDQSIKLLQYTDTIAVTQSQKLTIKTALDEANKLLTEKNLFDQGVTLANDNQWNEALVVWHTIPESSPYTVKYKTTSRVPHQKPQGDYVSLTNYTKAHDPTFNQLLTFLKTDPTDDNRYDLNSFVCTNFAEMLHNTAEQKGIRATYIGVRFTTDPGHALVAFNTTDKGMVYIDPTGKGDSDVRDDFLLGNNQCEWDKVAFLVEGKDYGTISINYSPINPTSYTFYEDYMKQWNTVKANYTQLEKAIKDYNQRKTKLATNLIAFNQDKQNYEKLVTDYEKSQALIKDTITSKNQNKVILLTDKVTAWKLRNNDFDNRVATFNDKVKLFNTSQTGDIAQLQKEELQLTSEKDAINAEMLMLKDEENKINKEYEEEVTKANQENEKQKTEIDTLHSVLDTTSEALSVESQSLTNLENKFNRELKGLQNQEIKLGTCYWKSLGLVTKIETYW